MFFSVPYWDFRIQKLNPLKSGIRYKTESGTYSIGLMFCRDARLVTHQLALAFPQ